MGVSVYNGKLYGDLYAVTTAETLGNGSAYWRSRTRISNIAGFGLLRDEAAVGKNARLSIHIEKQPDGGSGGLLRQESDRMKADLRAAGNTLDIRMEWLTDSGNRLPIVSLNDSVILRFPLPSGAERELLGLYFIGNDGRLVYAGGKLNGEWVEAELHRTGQYMLLEYDKEFVDVPSSHWANRVIKALSAQHVIEGVNDTEFNPQSAVTRAEFIALLVRLLQLKPVDGAAFADVPSGAWYAEAVGAAAAAGLTEGADGNRFMPEEEVSREQMAVMLLRACEIMTGRKTGGANGSVDRFADQADISDWAQLYVRAAKEMGLVHGRESNRFEPLQPVTRAESAQAVYNLLGLLH
ncbi:S-layer homology domain-containing protein [Paenibacillus eucommiae]|uniref:SLH domain-containing protein n=1 Tax=Paenibacillus eucommiae TaxID=1355755 RepID=A0ABS4IMP8_9BACL|nr:S-layer homology domain-containing protein [Paenibacillus eucommiae]MBP1988832.1 hypothetical protein [Paenibacillus eucommiae]